MAANQLPAHGLPALPNAQAPPNPPLGVAAQLQTLRQRAGPQLNPLTQPPWRRAGAVPAGPHRPAWPNRPANYVIPLSQPLPMTPDINTRQDGVNTFLTNLNGQFYGAGPGTANPTVRAAAGPKIYRRELSSRNPQHRLGTFHHYPNPHNTSQQMVGTLPLPPGLVAMPLAEYSGTVGDAVAETRIHSGTLFLIASREAPEQLRVSSAWRRFLAHLAATGNPAPPQFRPNQVPGGLPTTTSDLWHNTAVFIQSRTDYPRPTDDYGDGSRPRWLQYTGTNTFRACYVYDPSYIHESIVGQANAHGALPPGAATLGLQANNWHRLHNFLFMSVVYQLLYSNAGFNNRCRWLRWPTPTNQAAMAPTVWIGGGGNVGGVDECRRMACVWMQQVAYLSRALSVAIRDFHQQKNAQTEQAFLNAEHEWEQFFLDYVPLRP